MGQYKGVVSLVLCGSHFNELLKYKNNRNYKKKVQIYDNKITSMERQLKGFI